MNRNLREKLAARSVQEQCTEAADILPSNRILKSRDVKRRQKRHEPRTR